MIAWRIPLARCVDTHDKQPLVPLVLTAQKDCFARYLMYVRAGKRLDMGKICRRRVKALDELLADVQAPLLKGASIARYVKGHEALCYC